MPTIQPNLFLLILLSVQAVLYLPIIAQAIRRRWGQEIAAFLVGLYVFLAFVLQAFQAVQRGGLLPGLQPMAGEAIQWYGTLALALLLILVVRTFLRINRGMVWLGIGGIWSLALFLVGENVLGLPEIIWTNGRVMIPRQNLNYGLILIGWLLFTTVSILTVQQAFRRTRQPLHRNRLTYWMPIFLLLAANDALIFYGYTGWGNPLRLAGAFLVSYAVLTHHLTDIRQVLRRTLVFIITTILTGLFFAGGFLLFEDAIRSAPGYNYWLIGVGIALVSGLLATAVVGPLQKGLNRLFSAERYDLSQALREYSLSISNILDMERLATVAVGLTMEVMEIERGYLFLVDHEASEDGKKTYHLRQVRSAGERPAQPAALESSSPLVRTLLQDQRPLLQYDIDLHPAFRKISGQERAWFEALQAEVYAPIFAKREWIGLLALGAKLSGNRYTDNDLVTLSTLANQTAVALENARLVEDLVKLNKQLRQAGQALDQANRNLERLDRTKSDFISIASHELRTPLTIMRGYTEMLLEDEQIQQNAGHAQMIKSLHDGTMRLHEIMDSMFDIAEIDSRTLKLHMQAVDAGELIRSVCKGVSKTIAERSQSLNIDLPSFPMVNADPNILRKVFYHLVQNAIKFTPNGGKISIHGRVILSKSDMPDGGIEIVVSDSGVGIDPNFREVIFTKFYQADESLNKHSTSKSRFKGSGAGLGLALSRGIVEAHGGKIWVESPGYDEVHFPGSHFHLILPLQRLKNNETVRMGNSVKMSV